MSRRRVLFIGFDSAEPTLLDRWCSDGSMPALAGLRAKSAWSRVDVPDAFGNGAIWPSLFAGVNPGKHGRYVSVQPRPGSYEIEPFRVDTDYPIKPFWTHLSESGRTVAIVDMVRAPLTEGLRGFQLADWLTHDRRDEPTRSFPPTLTDEVESRYGYDEFEGMSENLYPNRDQLGDYLAALEDRARRKADMVIDHMQEHDWDLFMVAFGEGHDVGHRFWHLHDLEHPDYDPAVVREHGDPVKRVYETFDRELGRILKAAPDAEIWFFGGPGIESSYCANKAMQVIVRALEANEPAAKRKQGVPLATRVRRVGRRVLPRMLRKSAIGMVPSSARDRLSAYTERKYYDVPYVHNAGAIRINVRGREPLGLVERGAEYDSVCASLTEKLLRIRNAETGEALVDHVVKVRDVCHGSATDRLPDLLAVWNRRTPIRRIESPDIGEVAVDGYERTGDHTQNCILYVSRPDTVPGPLTEPVHVYDIAPTIASILDVELKDVDGKVLWQGSGPAA
jgi:predicted AlkP superfamily phosphohydrolase/phosphomutase